MRELHEGIELDVALLQERPFHALLRACHEAEESSMSEKAIKKGFRGCGIYPFSKNIIKQLVKENAGVSSEKGIEYKKKNAVSAAIKERKRAHEDREKNISKGEAKVEKNHVYGPLELRNLDRKRRREEEAMEVEKSQKMNERKFKKPENAIETKSRKKERETKICRGEYCKSAWKSSQSPMIYHCGSSYVYPKCAKAEDNGDLLSKYSEHCDAKISERNE